MSKKNELNELFHQPRRLELMAELCGAESPRSFSELKQSCNLTDGNLSKHLHALEKAGMVRIKKSFVESKPLTTATVTPKGRENFVSYLSLLEEVLQNAAKQAKILAKERGVSPSLAKLLKSI